MIKEFTIYIRDNMAQTVIVPIIGTNLFAGYRPDDAPDTCITVLERDPSVPNPMLPDTFQKPVQILTRSDSYMRARQLAMEIHDILYGINNVGILMGPIVSGGDVYQVNMVTGSEPAWLGVDDRNRFEFTSNYVVNGQKNP